MNSSAVTISELHSEPTVGSYVVSEQVQESVGNQHSNSTHGTECCSLTKWSREYTIHALQAKLESKIEF